ncbi:hypothetical protein ANDO1_0378 [plant metagenome]|uniref:Uncharacterized protein n=1 Tax=plant metagenome TaxID=1297885 RepID=A0A484Q1F0_9ZZZZ
MGRSDRAAWRARHGAASAGTCSPPRLSLARLAPCAWRNRFGICLDAFFRLSGVSHRLPMRARPFPSSLTGCAHVFR